MAHVIVAIFLLYALLGALFGVAFALRGAGVIDPAARKAPLAFKILIVPGAAALWPWLLRRWLKEHAAPEGHG